MMSRMFKSVYYKNLADLVAYGLNDDVDHYGMDSSDMIGVSQSLLGWGTGSDSKLGNYDNIFEYKNSAWKIKDDIASFLNHLIDRYNRGIVCHFDDNDSQSDYNYVYAQWWLDFIGKIQETAPKYLKLINIYKDNESKLLDRVSTITNSINKFNDTPQEQGAYEGDTYTSNIAQGEIESASDVNTLMARIREIQDSYVNVERAWENEFDTLFLREENIR